MIQFEPPKWLLSDLEKAMNDAGIATPNHLSYSDGIVYTHNDSGELVELDSEAQAFAQDWITQHE